MRQSYQDSTVSKWSFIVVPGCQEVIGGQAKDGVKLLDSWGEFRCRKTGILLPLHVKYLTEADGYWITLGMAARMKDSVKLDPSFADRELPRFTQQECMEALAYVR